jgi:hypothetical protein
MTTLWWATRAQRRFWRRGHGSIRVDGARSWAHFCLSCPDFGTWSSVGRDAGLISIGWSRLQEFPSPPFVAATNCLLQRIIYPAADRHGYFCIPGKNRPFVYCSFWLDLMVVPSRSFSHTACSWSRETTAATRSKAAAILAEAVLSLVLSVTTAIMNMYGSTSVAVITPVGAPDPILSLAPPASWPAVCCFLTEE